MIDEAVGIIGIDCATEPVRMGLALGELSTKGLVIHEVGMGKRKGPKGKNDPPVQAWVADRVRSGNRTLIALDAPLGWPVGMTNHFPKHQAGEPLAIDANDLFSRHTDRVVRDKIGKRPLEVGANLIARTALSALALIELIGQNLGTRIPLAWSPDDLGYVAAVEVYPAATVLAHRPKSQLHAEAKLDLIRQQLDSDPPEGVDDTLDIIDACLCVVAGADFLRDDALPPEGDDKDLAKKEGWIWVKKSGAHV